MKKAMFLAIIYCMFSGMVLAQSDYLTFNLSEKVIRQKVSYKNRFGIVLKGNLYLPKNIDSTKKHAVIIIGTPYGSVKEQTAGIYAQTMAERGFVTLAFDNSFNGESGGEPRRIASPEIFVEDYSASVDYIGTRSYVDRTKIGVIGVCGGGGFALSAAQVDTRIKAIATSVMADISRGKRDGRTGVTTDEERNKRLNELGEQRWKDFEAGNAKMNAGAPQEINANTDKVARDFYDYYRTPRGKHPNSTTEFTATSNMAFMNFPLLTYINSISPRPILLIAGEKAYSRFFSEDAYKAAAEPKELVIIPNAVHVDLYDKLDVIPFDKLDKFFKENLK